MATLKQRMHKKNSSGTYDTVHLETSSSLVLRPSGRTVEQDLADYLPKTQASDTPPSTLKSASLIVGTSKAWIGINETPEELIFMGSEMNIGTINGLTVDQILDKMANKGIGMYPGLSGSGAVEGKLLLGETIAFDGMYWIVCHVDYIQKLAYLACTVIVQNTTFGSSTSYSSSQLKNVAKAFENNMSSAALARMQNVTVHGVTAKVFAATYDQMNGGFAYFNSNERRVCQNQWYWTSSPGSGSLVWTVGADGGLRTYYGPSDSGGFRPFVCLSL